MDGLAHSYRPDELPERTAANDADVPLVVDLDGTLIKTDLLFESLLSLVKRRPLWLLMLPFWLLAGKAVLKREIARRTQIDVRLLPYNEALLEYLRAQRQSGRRLVLATGADALLARDVADYLGLFDTVHASDADNSLTGVRKRDRLVACHGQGGFDYVGNELRDLAIWRAARRCHAVALGRRLRGRIERSVSLQNHFEAPGGVVRALLRALRPHQWSKNLLVLVPVLAAHISLAPTLLG
ncbi:MAG: haloacid dehalogenase-like hydrolase, partial [Gammaproteobacteria bacterium]|nr:haloacid dehalogenase-like hydrolase [Gammaproteobacteria bacterium]